MKNFPFKAINPDTNEEQTFWYSRSIAAAIVVFSKDDYGNWYVLANKRGPGCPDFTGYWVCPCGYLDFGETVVETAARECFEETGVKLPIESIKFIGYNDSPRENRQNVTFKFVTILDSKPSTSNFNNEEKETTDIQWIPFTEISNYKWAFDHEDLITKAYSLKNLFQ